ncbi:MAG: glycosyltransferase family 2 protein [Thermoplasmata archaeon]|nr:glycosyltransferase family 2 protein [Thermoplasmata archaeon]
MDATLVIPTLNEGASIGHVLRSFRADAARANGTLFASDPVRWNILVVDGRSTDGTPERAEAEGATVLKEPRKGYGRAYRTGFSSATGEFVATMDGDATYPTAQIPQMLRQLIDEKLDFISGDRLSTLDPRAMTTMHRIGNRALNLFTGLAFHRFLRSIPDGRIRDTQSGMWVFRRRVLDTVVLTQDGMPMSEELKLEVLIRGYRFLEVPITYSERWGAPKLSSWNDGRRNMMFLLRKRFALEREIRGHSPAGRSAHG